MNYSKYYDKLKENKYSTIRKRLKGRKVDYIENETLNDRKLHYAIILKIESRPLDRISTRILLEDTAPFTKNREQCYELFQSFYENPVDFAKEKFYIFYLNKIRIKLIV